MAKRTLVCVSVAMASSIVAPSIAFAHPGLDHVHGFTAGLIHPVTGVDHVLAMIAVGLLASNIGGRALWAVPLSFMTLMVAGGALGMANVHVPLVEFGIGMSIVIFGMALLLDVGIPTFASVALVGFFAIFHGHAHGAEMPETAAGVAYGVGFVCATGLLHLVGIVIGLAARRIGRAVQYRILPIAGGVLALAGCAVLAGAI